LDKVRIANNLRELQQRIDEAARRSGRTGKDVRLVAVTKTVGVEEVEVLFDLGLHEFGENRLHDAQPKIEAFAEKDVTWHMIGSVQRRKARDVVELFDYVDSVDRYELAEALDRRCQTREHALPVLVEVNVSNEATKHGFEPGELDEALKRMDGLEHLRVEGLMTMAPFVADPEKIRPVFAGLRRLAEQVGLPELSMGMSNDFEVAVEEGATQVRIGSLLFA
jgi:pyridoxal phosphate enzyme (YggS family)